MFAFDTVKEIVDNYSIMNFNIKYVGDLRVTTTEYKDDMTSYRFYFEDCYEYREFMYVDINVYNDATITIKYDELFSNNVCVYLTQIMETCFGKIDIVSRRDFDYPNMQALLLHEAYNAYQNCTNPDAIGYCENHYIYDVKIKTTTKNKPDYDATIIIMKNYV